MPSLLRSVALLFALFATIAFAVHPVEVRGQNFVDKVTNKRVQIVGVDYQPGGQAGYKPITKEDPMSNATTCLRDAALLQRLGVNTIRVYNIDPSVNHDECASIFNAVGIYMIVDVNSPLGGESINRADPASSYHVGYLTRIFGIVENYKNYPNTMAFFAANEVMNNVENAKNNPRYIRAVQRDLKNYIAKHADRAIPVGYSAADVREILQDSWAYFQCAIDGKQDDKSRSDFFGLNSYSWCGGDATFESSGYNVLVDMFKDTTIPVFFSEYGCNKVKPRVFNEVQALYGTQMTGLSGGLVYEYSQEEADFGLVQINKNATVTLGVDYENLQKSYTKLDVKLLQSQDPSNNQKDAPKCSQDMITNKAFDANLTIPSPPDGADDLINNGIQNAVQGKIVDVKDTNVPMAIYGSNGQQVQSMAIRPLANDQSNTPGGENTAPAPGGDQGKKPGSASTLSVNTGCLALLFTVFMVVLTMS